MLLLSLVKLFEEFDYALPFFLSLPLLVLFFGLIIWGGLAWTEEIQPKAHQQTTSGWLLAFKIFLALAPLVLIAVTTITIGEKLGLNNSQAKQLGLVIIWALLVIFAVRENLRPKDR